MAKRIPGKQEFHETLRYFRRQLELTGVAVQLNRNVDAADLRAQGFDEIVIATGVLPRNLVVPGIDHPKVLSYVDVLLRAKPVGESVAIIGAGGIGFDVAEFLADEDELLPTDAAGFFQEWGIDKEYRCRGALTAPQPVSTIRQITMLQRRPGPFGRSLGKTTGWIHRMSLRHRQVSLIGGVSYERIDAAGLHILVNGDSRTLPVDNVIICAGQEPNNRLYQDLDPCPVPVHLIGGSRLAVELDAKRAIDEGTRLAAAL